MAGPISSDGLIFRAVSTFIILSSDMNECVEQTDNCAQDCFNQDGSYTCGCFDGFELNTDGSTCICEFESPIVKGGGPDTYSWWVQSLKGVVYANLMNNLTFTTVRSIYTHENIPIQLSHMLFFFPICSFDDRGDSRP